MKKRERLLAASLALGMTAALASCGQSGGQGSVVLPTPGADAKWKAEQTKDGWIQVTNEGGETLGYSAASGVQLVEDTGYAFKDLNKNGKLDAYEDWRLSTQERAADLIAQMTGAEKAAILSHGGWGSFTTDPLAEDDGSYTFLMAGGRGGVTRNIGRGGGEHAKWTNQIQAVAESCFYGIPAMISIDPAKISGLVETTALASTMDPELAAKIGQETAKQYRAAGVTALLGPQIDIAGASMSRAGGTYGEDPQLTVDIATAYVNAMQSTYDDSGNDLGWGEDSVFCFTKHFVGAGATEAGRDDHHYTARYTVFPGGNLGAHLAPFFDGVLNLPGRTESAGIMTQYSVNVDGEELSGAYNAYTYGMLDAVGYDSLTITDWGVYDFAGIWGAEDMADAAERIAFSWERGAELLGGFGTMESVSAAYEKLVERNGEEKAEEIIDHAASNFITVMLDLNMFDQPYNDSAYADSVITTGGSSEFALEGQRDSVVMLKNDGTIAENGAGSGKPTVYIPYVYNTGFSVSWMGGVNQGTPSWTPSMDLEVMGKYFNVVTDTLGEPTGEKDEDGNAAYTEKDLVRASAEEIAKCDYILVGMSNPYSASYTDPYVNAFGYMEAYQNGTLYPDDIYWYPVSMQYGAYTADTARQPSISGVMIDGEKQDRSYKGNTAPEAANYGDLEALQYADSVAGDIPVIVSMKMDRGMVWSEVEPLADVILGCYSTQYNDVVAEIILGKTEPNGLLVFQQPKDMAAVEAQQEDVPRDLECYVDANGNTYDFAFGMNWSGVIDDERVEKYSAAPLTGCESFDLEVYNAAYGK